LIWILAGNQEAYIEQVDLQTDKNKRKIAQLQKENKEKRQKLKELLEVSLLIYYFSFI
jgi:hypothetical protein